MKHSAHVNNPKLFFASFFSFIFKLTHRMHKTTSPFICYRRVRGHGPWDVARTPMVPSQGLHTKHQRQPVGRRRTPVHGLQH